MLPADIRGLYEAYNQVHEKDDLITDDLIEEVVEELIQECVEFGYEFEEAADIVEDAAIEYLMELNPYAPAGSKEAKAYQKSTTATKRGVERRAAVTAAKEKVKAKAKGTVAAAGIAGSIAKDNLRRMGRAAAHTVTHNVQKKKAEVKSGVKSLLGKGLRKAAGAVGKVASKASGAASRLGEEYKVAGAVLAKLRKEDVNVFDTVLEFLQVEGYENPEQLMSELSSEHIEAILEAQEARNNPEKYEREQDKKYAPVRGEKRPMPPRGHKDREAFEKWYAANVR